jgi:hypothetical protein
VYTLKSKILAINVILLVIFSQIVFAQRIDDGIRSEDVFRDDNGDFNEDGRFKDEFREDIDGREVRIKEEFRDDGYRREIRSEDERHEERFEFEDRRRYDNEPDFGPRYENKEEMLFGRLFGLIEDDINEIELLSHCGKPDEIADIVIDKVKDRIGDISNACSDIKDHELECKERIQRDCSHIGQPDASFARDEREKMEMLAYSCPPNRDMMVELCILNSREWINDREQYLEEDCEFEWERYGGAREPECQRIGNEGTCDEDNYMEQCMHRYGSFDDDPEDDYFECPDIHPTDCSNGYIEEEFDNNGCLINSFCVQKNEPQENLDGCEGIRDPVCGDDGVTYYNKCEAESSGVGYSYGECQNCPISDDEANRMENDCYKEGGNPERFYDNECVVEVNCHFPDDNQITGTVVRISGAFTYEEAKKECKREWSYEKDNCESMKQHCDKGDFVNQCIQREKENMEFDIENNRRQCERDARLQMKQMDRDCSRMDAERDRCFEQGNRQCGEMEGLASECDERMTEENFRAFIIKESDKHCKFVPFLKKNNDFGKYDKMEITLAVLDTITDEEISKLGLIVEDLNRKFELDGRIILEGIMDPNKFVEIKRLNFVVDAKLNAPESSDRSRGRKEELISRLDPQRVVEKLLELRDTDVSSEYRYLIEDQASDILDVSDEIGELEEREDSKGIGYKLKLFLGFAKEAEESEITNLRRSKDRLEASIVSLSKLSDEVPDDIAKSILKAQVEDLERQKLDMDDLINQKVKKSKGLLQLFGLFG